MNPTTPTDKMADVSGVSPLIDPFSFGVLVAKVSQLASGKEKDFDDIRMNVGPSGPTNIRQSKRLKE